LYILNVSTGKLDAIPQGETSWTLNSKIIMDLYQDHESRIWIATLRAGVALLLNSSSKAAPRLFCYILILSVFERPNMLIDAQSSILLITADIYKEISSNG